MAFSSMGAGNGRSGRGRGVSIGAMAEMNVVPLVDVVLVLLIIFMLTAHVMEFGLEIEAPQVKTTETTAPDTPAVVSLTRDGRLFLNEKPVTNINLLADTIHKQFKDQKEVYIRADRRAQVEQLVNVISVLHDAMFKINVVAKVEDLGNKP